MTALSRQFLVTQPLLLHRLHYQFLEFWRISFIWFPSWHKKHPIRYQYTILSNKWGAVLRITIKHQEVLFNGRNKKLCIKQNGDLSTYRILRELVRKVFMLI